MTEVLLQPEVNGPQAHELGMVVVALEASPQVERAYEVTNAIDPEHVLPEVEVIADPSVRVSRGSLVPQKSLIMCNGRKIGECTIVSDNKERTRWFNGIEVIEKGKGYGSAAYKTVIKHAMLDGYDFRTHEWSQTEDAKRVWERLANKGVARVEQPFVSDGKGRFSGSYVVEAVK